MFANIKIRDRLIILLGALLIPLFLVAWMGDRGMGTIRESLGVVYEHRAKPLAMLNNIRRDFARTRASNLLIVIAPNDEARNEATRLVTEQRAQLTKDWSEFYASLLTQEGHRLSDATWAAIQTYLGTVDLSERMLASPDKAR